MRLWSLVAASLLSSCVSRPSPSAAPCRISDAQSGIARQYAQGAGGIRGRVIAVRSLTPLPDALIEVQPGGIRTFSDTAGNFRIPLSRVTYVLRIRRLGYETVVDTIDFGGLDGFDVTALLAQPNPGLIGCDG